MSKDNQIGRFSYKSIFQANDELIILPDCKSKNSYVCDTDSNFCVLEDESTVLGVHSKHKSMIIKENIIEHSSSILLYNKNQTTIYTLALHEQNNTFFAGEDFNYKGRIVQYDLETGQMIRNYGSIGVSCVISSARFGRFICFGGLMSKFVVVDTLTRRIVQGLVQTIIRCIDSIEFFAIFQKKGNFKVLVTVTGWGSDYLKGRSDVFDFTELTKIR